MIGFLTSIAEDHVREGLMTGSDTFDFIDVCGKCIQLCVLPSPVGALD